MKRIGIKKLLIIGMIIFGMDVAFAAKGFTGTQNAYVHLYKYDVAFAKKAIPVITPALGLINPVASASSIDKIRAAEDAFSFNRKGVFKYGSAILSETYEVKVLKSELKNELKAKDKQAVKRTERKLMKAKFDLFRDQCHLVIDREALRQDYLMSINNHRQDLNTVTMDLNKEKARLKKQTALGNKEEILVTQKKISAKQDEIKEHKMAIAREKGKLKKDMKFADSLMNGK